MTKGRDVRFGVSDKRSGFAIIDNALIDHYGPTIGAYGIAAYCILVRFARPDGTDSFPSYQTIADLMGASRSTAIRAINRLVTLGLIEKEDRKTKGEPMSNMYTLLDIKKPQGLHEVGSVTQQLPSSPQQLGSVTGEPDQDTLKNTQLTIQGSATTTTTPDRANQDSSSRRRQPSTPAKDGSAKPDPFYAEMQTAIESNGFGMMTPIMAGEVKKMITTYPAEWIREAMRIAVSSNALRLAYVNGVLENWQREGFSYDSRKHHSDRKGSTNGATKRTNQQGTGKDEPADDYHANAWYANLGTPSV